MEIADSATDKSETETNFAQMLLDKPEQVFSSYKSRTAKEILVMADAWKQKKEDGAAISPDGLLQTFLHHLDGEKVPKVVKPSVENDRSDRAWASLNGLAGGFSSEFSSNPKLRAQLISAWPGVFKWCRYFYDQRVASEKDSETAEKAINTLCNTIRAYISIQSAFIPFSLLHANTWDGMDEIVAAAGGKPEAVAKPLLNRLRLTINQFPIHPDLTFTLAFILSTFMCVPRHPLSFAILADNGVWVTARATFLRNAMVQYDSPRLVSQAVDAGLLRAICALSRILDDLEQSKPSHDDLKQLKLSLRFILGDILPKSMMYRSVIKVMKDEHKEIDPDVPDKTIMRSYLREEWMSLVLLLYLRSTIAKFPKQIRGKELAKRKFPKEPVENFIICIDYTNPKYPLGLTRKSCQCRGAECEMIKMVRLNPREYTFIEATFAYGRQRLTRNLMLRPNRWVQPPEEKLSSALNWQNNKCENQDGPAEGLLELFLAMNIQCADL
ncbi:hypothetical protein B0H13DRAFT_2446332 [Mycena leptocephala]|nr:hypothetical protein B0H13DRAFT_2446332 [Mycena leptocephala]